jgi:ribosome-binding protein aMBF1 (putative translation factor)
MSNRKTASPTQRNPPRLITTKLGIANFIGKEVRSLWVQSTNTSRRLENLLWLAAQLHARNQAGEGEAAMRVPPAKRHRIALAFGAVLKAARKQCGLSQEDLS